MVQSEKESERERGGKRPKGIGRASENGSRSACTLSPVFLVVLFSFAIEERELSIGFLSQLGSRSSLDGVTRSKVE